MRKSFTLFLLACLLLTTVPAFTQYYWHQPVRLTNGYTDRNPSFGLYSVPGTSFYSICAWEFLVFERTWSSNSQICLLKIGNYGLLDSVFYVTTNAYTKRNPSLSYGKYNQSIGSDINSAFVLWESNQNGKWDLYGRYYVRQSGWGTVFPFDSSAGDKSKPKVCYIDSVTYAVTFVKNGDVYFRKYNPVTRAILYDTNLTATDTAICSNASLTAPGQNMAIITYEKYKPDGKKAIWFKKTSSLPVWSAADTVAYYGNNKFDRFVSGGSSPSAAAAFESERGGNIDLYYTTIPYVSGVFLQSRMFSGLSAAYNYTGYTEISYPIITDVVPSHANAFLRKGRDSLKIIYDNTTSGVYYTKDSTTIGDTSKTTSIAMNGGIYNNNYITAWLVYSKDSASYTQLYGRYRLMTLGDIRRIGNIVPEKFSLDQNYPNPFNPVTNIRFDLPRSGFVTLKVYDISGREAAELINGKFNPGTYEVTFNGNGLSSGVYFYRMRVDNEEIAVKRMVLIK